MHPSPQQAPLLAAPPSASASARADGVPPVPATASPVAPAAAPRAAPAPVPAPRGASTPTAVRGGRRRIGELLVAGGLLTEVQLHDALASRMLRAGRRERLGETIVRMGYASDDDIAAALAVQLGLAVVSAEELRPDEAAVAAVPGPLAQRHGVLPLRLEGDVVVLAVADPTDFVAFDDIRVATGLAVRVVVAPSAALARASERALNFGQRNAGELLSALEGFGVEELADVSADTASVNDAPVVRLAEGIISAALDERASDIHVEPTTAALVVRYRIDGVLQQRMAVPLGAAPALVSRLKLIAGMDIAERRRPQDGRAHVTSGNGQQVDLRVSSMPSMFGETVVLRLLRRDSSRPRLSEVGFSTAGYATVRSAIDRPQGLVLLAGPTGSGKTSTLYAALTELTGEERKIITLEDPVEYQLDGVNQTQINDRIGLTFASCLRTVLRQDPDIVMVGEIRDSETAELALQASLTGHLVFTTLHTNDAPGAVTRLTDLGIPPYLLAGAMTLVVAQRLARAVCPDCAAPDAPPTTEVADRLNLHPRALEGAALVRGRGCVSCADSGYRGRLGLFELLPFDAPVRRLVAAEASEAAIRRTARRAGMATLREDGLRHARESRTTLDEVLRVAPVDEHAGDTCPSCAGLVEEGFVCCPWCGTGLGAATCTTCARPLERGWSWCPACGAGNGTEQTTAVAAARPHG